MSPPLESPPKIPPSPLLEDKLSALRRKHLRTAILTGLAFLTCATVLILAALMFFDWLIDFPWTVRAALLAAQIAVWGYITGRFVITPILRQPTDDALALQVEKANPKLRTRLIAAIQLPRPDSLTFGASPVLARATVRGAEELAKHIDFSSIVPTDRLKKFASLAVIIVTTAAFALSYGKDTAGDLLKRAFLSHVSVPRKTHVLVVDGNKTIGRGDNVRLEAIAQGVVPRTGKVEVKSRSRHPQEYKLDPDTHDRARFTRTIENVQDSFTYVVFLNDGQSQTYTVTALPRPTVASIQCEQEYPPYTGLKPTQRSPGDLSLLAGSILKLKITATKPIAAASITLVGIETNTAATIPLDITPQQPRELTGQFTIPAKNLTGFSVQLRDTEGMDSSDSAVYRVDIIPDKPPVVRLTYPDRKEELLTRHATMLVGMDISDDFEIAKIRIRYKAFPPTATNEISSRDVLEKSVDLDLQGENPQHLKRRYEWKIGSFDPLLPEGTKLEFWLEAEDNNNVTGPGIGVSEHQYARIVSDSEKRADLLNRAGDYLGSISDVAGDQEKLNTALGAIIREKTNTPNNPNP